jgi:hypothetical protein
MNWRITQLGTNPCDQDLKILSLFDNKPVRYIGYDIEFLKTLTVSDSSANLILILNQPMWCSEIIDRCNQVLDSSVDNFYIGINRYQVLGNDTNKPLRISDNTSQDLIDFLTVVVQSLGFNVVDSGSFNNDLGRYFNFVQPLTWIFGTNECYRPQ